MNTTDLILTVAPQGVEVTPPALDVQPPTVPILIAGRSADYTPAAMSVQPPDVPAVSPTMTIALRGLPAGVVVQALEVVNGTAQVMAVPVHTNEAPTGALVIAGQPREGSMLVADHSGLADLDGIGSVSIQWYRDGVPDVPASARELMPEDVGCVFHAVASYVDGYGQAESVTSATVGPVEALPPPPPPPPPGADVWAVSSVGQGGLICGPTSGALGTLRLLDQEIHVPHDVPAATEVVLALANYGDDPVAVESAAVAASTAHMQASSGLAWTTTPGVSMAGATKLPNASGVLIAQARSPGWAETAPVPLSIASRTDGGLYRVIRARAIGPAGSGSDPKLGWHVQMVSAADVTAAKNDPRNTQAVAYAGTGTSAASAGVIATASTSISEVAAVMLAPLAFFKVPAGHKSVVCFGDSIYTQGGSPTGLGLGQLLHYKAQATGARISAAQRSQNGQTHAASLICARALLALPVRPTHILVNGWSVNSGISQAVFDACWTDLQAFVAECQAVGVVPVVPTIARQNGGWVPSILAQNERIKSLSGVVVPDFEAAMTDTATGYTKAEYMADGVHWSAAGMNVARDTAFDKLAAL